MASIYLVRHGQASFGAENYDQLSTLGEEQCRLLGAWWRARNQTVVRVACGPMLRHRQSLAAFSQSYGHEFSAENLNGLAEFDHENVLHVHYPAFADRKNIAAFIANTPNPKAAFHDIFTQAINRWHDGRFDADYNEAWPVFKQRVVNTLQRLSEGSGDVLVFTSGGAISVMLQKVLGVSDAKCFALNAITVNSSVTRLLYRADEMSLHSFNNIAHLEAENSPSLITYR